MEVNERVSGNVFAFLTQEQIYLVTMEERPEMLQDSVPDIIEP